MDERDYFPIEEAGNRIETGLGLDVIGISKPMVHEVSDESKQSVLSLTPGCQENQKQL